MEGGGFEVTDNLEKNEDWASWAEKNTLFKELKIVEGTSKSLKDSMKDIMINILKHEKGRGFILLIKAMSILLLRKHTLTPDIKAIILLFNDAFEEIFTK